MDINIDDNKGKGFLSEDTPSQNDEGNDEGRKVKFKEILSKHSEGIELSEQDKNMLKELETQSKKYLKKVNEKFDDWYGENKDYLMREYIDENQKEFREFCGKIFMEEDEKEERKNELLNEDDLKIEED